MIHTTVGKGSQVASAGFITYVILITAALFALAYVGLDVRAYLDSPKVRENIAQAGEAVAYVADSVITPSAIWLWEKFQEISKNFK
jgi:hypothetical protein